LQTTTSPVENGKTGFPSPEQVEGGGWSIGMYSALNVTMVSPTQARLSEHTHGEDGQCGVKKLPTVPDYLTFFLVYLSSGSSLPSPRETSTSWA